MKYLIKNKSWKIDKNYSKEKLLYLLIDKPTIITPYGSFVWKNYKNQFHRDYDLPAYIWNDGDICWYLFGYPIREIMNNDDNI